MSHPTGVHHLAISTADIRAQVAFFSEVLAMELVALYPMHGVKGAVHAFMKANDHCYIAFVGMAAIADIPIELGKTHAGSGAGPSAPGTMQHLALNVDSEEDMLAMRDRVRLKGIPVFGPINHGLCKSIYFAGPEHLTLEISTSRQAIDARAWVDPVTCAQAGMTPREIERYKHPERTGRMPTPVAQPAFDPARPHMHMPPEEYKRRLAMSDAEYAAWRDEPTPPVQVRDSLPA